MQVKSFNMNEAMGKFLFGIPGLTFSWKRALGITKTKQGFARQTGVPTSKTGAERKMGKTIINVIKNLIK